MAFRQSKNTQIKVHLVKLHLNQTQSATCETARHEAAKCWNDVLDVHINARDNNLPWPWANELKKLTLGKYELQSHSVQAICEKFESNVKIALALIKAGDKHAKLPYRTKKFVNVQWKADGLKIMGNQIRLSFGRGRARLTLPIPNRYSNLKIVLAELMFKEGHYWLALTEDTEIEYPVLPRRVKTAGIDLGEIHSAVVMTDEGKGISISGRWIRSIKQLRNKRHKTLDEKLARCRNGSKRHKRLSQLKKKASAKADRQERDVLHKTSRQVADFCRDEKVANVAVGDVRNIANGIDCGNQHNQRMSQWGHGQLRKYITEKLRVYGIRCDLIGEAYTTKTCSHCGNVKKTSPSGRTYTCSACGVKMSRDGNGSANICSKARWGEMGKVQPGEIKYLRPINIGRSRALEAGHAHSACC